MKTTNIVTIQKCRLGIAVAVCVSLLSCSNEADLQNTDDNVLFFASVDTSNSRVTESAWDGDELIGIKSGETVKAYKVATDGTMSTEDTPFRWEGTEYEIKAWSPLTTETINLTDQTTDEKFFDCDLLASSAKVESKSVRLVFNHQMTRMWWELQITPETSGYTTEEINGAKVTFLGYGSVKFEDGEVKPQGDANQEIHTFCWKGDYYWEGQAMMVPGEMWEKPLIRVKIGNDEFEYTPSKTNTNDVEKKTGILVPGAWQRYYLHVSKKSFNVDMVTVTSGFEQWTDNGSSDSDKGLVDAEMQ